MIYLFLGLLAAQETFFPTPDGQNIVMNYDFEKQKVKFKATVGQNKYFAIGFGTSMINTDMIIFFASDEGSVMDAYSTGYQAPTAEAIQSIEDLIVTIENGIYTFECYRAMNTGDPQDHVLEFDTDTPIIWSENTKTASL